MLIIVCYNYDLFFLDLSIKCTRDNILTMFDKGKGLVKIE